MPLLQRITPSNCLAVAQAQDAETLRSTGLLPAGSYSREKGGSLPIGMTVP